MIEVADLDPVAALASAVERRRTADAAEAELLVIAAHWADLHPVTGDPEGLRVPGMERLVPLAGPGAPEVAEFAPAELGAALGISTYAAQLLVGDSLELRHRLPRLWARVTGGTLPAWRGRKIAEHTRCLSPAAAAWVDAQVAPFAHKIGVGRLTRLVDAALLRFDPDEAARRVRSATEGRGVWLGDQMTDGTRSIHIEADALDATAFDHTIDQIAHTLGRLGDDDVNDVRRAKAVGVIADPQAALDLLTDDPQDTDSDDRTDGRTGTDADAGSAAGSPAGSAAGSGSCAGGGGLRRRGGPKVVLYLHLHQDAIRSGTGVGRVEGLGPVTIDQVRDWAGRSDLTINRVVDLDDRISVDAYEVPHRISETVILRNPCCPFPWCNNLSRHKDNDHISPYVPPDDGGPPGQTTPDNLAPLCRRHHRLKTHGGWTYTMAEPGIYLWKSPAGRRYLVDHTGTTALHHPA